MSKKISREVKLRQERRIMRVPIDLTVFGNMFRDGTPMTFAEGLPKSAIFLGASYSPEMYACSFFYGDESFEPVPNGGVVPALYVVLKRAAPTDTNTKEE